MVFFVSSRRRCRTAGAVTAAAAVIVLAGCAAGTEAGTESAAQVQEGLSEGRLVPASSAEGHALREVPAEEAPSVELEVTEDPWGTGWTVQVLTEDFAFAPERLGELHPQEGHAHLYLDGEKIGRIYSPWYALPAADVPPGEHELTVTLNANDDHAVWAVDGEPIVASTTVEGSEAPEDGHDHEGDHDHGTPGWADGQ